MAAPYKTPGVYVEEISTLPPSVAEVSTAIPAFLGYTKKDDTEIARVSTLLEYEEIFGGPPDTRFTIQKDAAGNIASVERTTPAHEFLMYYAVSHYFKNGGGACYIVSVGPYSTAEVATVPAATHFTGGLKLLEEEDEPTLIVLTDAVNLDAVGYNTVCQASLDHCHKLGDRFAIFDVRRRLSTEDPDVTDVKAFRGGIGMNYLAYGAAYYPYLKTSMSYVYKDSDVTIKPYWSVDIAVTIKVSYAGADNPPPEVSILEAEDGTTSATPDFDVTVSSSECKLTITLKDTSATAKNIADAWKAWSGVKHGFNVVALDGVTTGLAFTNSPTPLLTGNDISTTLHAIKLDNTTLYNQIKARLVSERVELPPSAAVAGIYASVDRDRGVWKAPANVSVSAVIGPSVRITNDIQDGLNLDDSGAGKSINAIRAFNGKGTLVWGARTLAGDDNEWRYVPVRRLFIMIEESARKSTAFAVFEPNDMTTWLKVKGMIESFLYGLWERGALAGPTPAAAYFVNVGLGKTMTTQDILEGRMIVEIGIAAVRPAEFIILRFSHKLQQA